MVVSEMQRRDNVGTISDSGKDLSCSMYFTFFLFFFGGGQKNLPTKSPNSHTVMISESEIFYMSDRIFLRDKFHLSGIKIISHTDT